MDLLYKSSQLGRQLIEIAYQNSKIFVWKNHEDKKVGLSVFDFSPLGWYSSVRDVF